MKKFMNLLVACSLLSLLAGCHKNDDNASKKPKMDQKSKKKKQVKKPAAKKSTKKSNKKMKSDSKGY